MSMIPRPYGMGGSSQPNSGGQQTPGMIQPPGTSAFAPGGLLGGQPAGQGQFPNGNMGRPGGPNMNDPGFTGTGPNGQPTGPMGQRFGGQGPQPVGLPQQGMGMGGNAPPMTFGFNPPTNGGQQPPQGGAASMFGALGQNAMQGQPGQSVSQMMPRSGQQGFGGYAYASPAAAAAGQATQGGLPQGFKPPQWQNGGIDPNMNRGMGSPSGSSLPVMGNGTQNPAGATPQLNGINSNPGAVFGGGQRMTPYGALGSNAQPQGGGPAQTPSASNGGISGSPAPSQLGGGQGMGQTYGPGGSAPGMTPAQQNSFNFSNSGPLAQGGKPSAPPPMGWNAMPGVTPAGSGAYMQQPQGPGATNMNPAYQNWLSQMMGRSNA